MTCWRGGALASLLRCWRLRGAWASHRWGASPVVLADVQFSLGHADPVPVPRHPGAAAGPALAPAPRPPTMVLCRTDFSHVPSPEHHDAPRSMCWGFLQPGLRCAPS